METLPSCPGEPKLDPRVRRTRKALEDAMRGLLRERTFGSISVGDVAERATVNRATFYAHYLDKQDLARSVLRTDLHADLVARLSHHPPLDAASLTLVGAAAFEFIGRFRSACPKGGDEMGEAVGTTLQDTLQTFILHWLSMDPQGVRAFGGASPETAAAVLSWSLYGGAIRWSTLTRRPPAEKAVREIVGMLVR